MDKLIGIFTDVGTELAKASVNKAIEEAGYLCCYQSYVDDFDDQRKRLSDVAGSVREDIKDARDRNKTRIDPVVQGWLDQADGLIQQDTKSKKKWFFGLCLNCFWQNRRSKELKDKTQVIKGLITDRGNLSQVARPAELIGIEFYSSPDFMHFESRKLKFEELKKELKDVKNCLIGLQGMGGTGKTTMAIQVGKEVQQLKVFDKVIFSTVSNAKQPADVIKIRCDIARHLGLPLDEGIESEHAEKLMTRIAKGEEKILIILDDVWDKELSLKNIGIALGQHEKGRCCVLITTRNLRICREMGCRKAIQLETISEKDALNLFLSHSGKSGDDDSSNTDFKEVALHIVNECGRLPVAIVPLARALNSEPLEYWNDTLTRLQKFDPMSHDVHEDLIESYNSLSLSYDNLKDAKAQKLFQLCSLFPEDFEVPVELLTRIAISMGLCGEAEKYYIARSQVSDVQRKLLDSCLLSKVAAEPHELNFSEFLSKAANKCVKMHDLIREVALLIAKEEIQVVMDSKSTLKENIQCSSWSINGFPDRFHGGKLEFLLLMTKTNGPVEVPDGLFKGVKKLRVLILICTNDSRIPAPSLMKSTFPLENIQTLSLSNWELGDISDIGILKGLETLELIKCSITELPVQVAKLKKLRLLGLRDCKIESENPFEVIEECPILEELYYVQNEDILYSTTDELDHIHIEPPATLERYHIVSRTYRSVDDSISRWFEPGYLSKIFSEATFKSLATRAEILALICYNEDIQLKVKELFRGPLDLGNLRSIRLESCPVTCLFDTSTAQSLKKLETLEIHHCGQLKCIIADERSDVAEVLDDPNEKGHGSLFNLKILNISYCPKLEFVFPIYFAENTQKLEEVRIESCEEFEYIFRQYSNVEGSYQIQNQVILPSLKEVSIRSAPKFSGMFPAECCIVKSTKLGEDGLKEKDGSKGGTNNAIPICCFFPKSSETLPDHTTSQPQMLKAKKGFNMAGCLMRSPLNPSFVTQMIISHCSSNNLTSLFTLGIASSMSSLEELTVWYCNGLKHIVSTVEEGDGDGDDHIHMNHNYSIFPKLRRLDVRRCELLEDVFPASHCTKLHHLEHIIVNGVPKLRYVFGKCSCQNHNVEILLPALEGITLINAPDMVNICTGNCFVKASSLESVNAGNVPQHVIRPFIDFRVGKLETQDITTRKVVKTQPENLTVLGFDDVKLDRIYDLEGHVKLRLNELSLKNLPLLTDICVGTRNILSFQNLGELRISGCKKLQFIFSASILRSLPQLKFQYASECPELLQIIEEDTQENSLVSQQNCFPQLRTIRVFKCNKLKCLFSITECGILPNLEELTIKEAPELMQVFGCKQGVSKELKHVFPKLSELQLHNLQSLTSVCQGIDFQMVPRRDVSGCPKISLTSTTEDTTSKTEESQAAKSQSMSSPPYISEEKTNQIVEDTSKRASNMTEIQEIEEEEACDNENGSKLNNSIIPYQTNIISEQSKSSQNESPQNVELSGVGEVPSLIEKDNKQTLSTCPKGDKEAHGGTSGDTMIVERKDSTFNPITEVTNETVEDTSKRSPTMTKIQEIEEAIDQTIISQSSKPSQAPCVIPYSQNESQQDMLVDEEAKKETKIMDQQAPTEKGPDMNSNNSQNDKLVGEGAKKETNIVGQEELIEATPDMHYNDSQNNIEVSVGDNPPLEKDCKPTSSTSSKLGIKYSGQDMVEASDQDGPKLNDSMIPDGIPSQNKSPQITSFSSYGEIQTEIATSNLESEASQSNQADVSGKTNSPQGQILVKQTQINIDEEIMVDDIIPEELEEDDIIKLFRMMEEGADIEVGMPYDFKIAAVEDDNKVVNAFADLEASLKMGLNEIACSEENSLSLQNALNLLSTYCSEDGASSHGISATIDSLQQEIQSTLSSFKKASSTIQTFTELEQKEKSIDKEVPRRKKAAKTLISEIYKTEKSVVKAKQKGAELKEKISIMQTELEEKISRMKAELDSTEEEIKDYEIKLLSLQDQKKKCASEAIGFMKEFESVKKGKSQMVEEQIKARQELEEVDGKWSSCVANLRKTTLLLGLHLNHKL